MFYETFFPAPPPEATRRAQSHYPPNAFEFTHISDTQILDACKHLKEYKAPGPDGIPNEVYKKCADIFLLFVVV